jgi:hypothetical protein
MFRRSEAQVLGRAGIQDRQVMVLESTGWTWLSGIPEAARV